MSERCYKDETCGTCFHFTLFNHEDKTMEGFCRRFPPLPNAQQVETGQTWPIYHASQPACGCWNEDVKVLVLENCETGYSIPKM